MVYLKATLAGTLSAVIVCVAVVVLFGGGVFWQASVLPIFVVNLALNIALTIACFWAIRRARRPALKWAILILVVVMSLALFVGAPLWSLFGTTAVPRSVGIEVLAASFGELFIETIPGLAFFVGFVSALPSEERLFPIHDLRLYLKASVVALLLGAISAAALSGPTPVPRALSVSIAEAVSPWLSQATPESQRLVALSFDSAMQSILAPLPLVAFAFGLVWILTRARRAAMAHAETGRSMAGVGRYAKAFLAGLLWVVVWRALTAPFWAWRLYALMRRDDIAADGGLAAATGFDAAELLTMLLLGGLTLVAFGVGSWWSLRRSRLS